MVEHTIASPSPAWVIRNVWLEDRAGAHDLAIGNGLIQAIGPDLPAGGAHEIDGAGCLASPFFVDPHIHLDKVFAQPEPNISGTLREAIEIFSRHQARLYGPDLDQRIDRALTWALRHGTLALRSHADVDGTSGTAAVDALLRARQRWADAIDIQIVAFPQQGIIRDPGTVRQLRQAIRLGADLVGGMPHGEATAQDARRHIDAVFDIAAEFNVAIDMHIDETDDPRSRTLEMLADATVRAGWQGRVTAGHCCALSAYDDAYAALVIDKVAGAAIAVVTNPPVNLMLQGRNDSQPVRRGITRVQELMAGGVTVTCGQDDIQDIFYPFGQADMLEVAFVTAHAAHLSSAAGIQSAFDMPRAHAAVALDLKPYGLFVGGPADLLLLDARSAVDALARRPARRIVMRRGRLLSSSQSSVETYFQPAGQLGAPPRNPSGGS